MKKKRPCSECFTEHESDNDEDYASFCSDECRDNYMTGDYMGDWHGASS